MQEMKETRVQNPGQEDPLEKEMATHSSNLAWKIPWTEDPVGCGPWGHKELDMTEHTCRYKPNDPLGAQLPRLRAFALDHYNSFFLLSLPIQVLPLSPLELF